jgi:hypothetical protein
MDSVNPDPKNIPDDDLQLQNYQDDLDTSSTIVDPIMDEESDDPTEELGVDRKEFKDELDKYDFDEVGHGDDDMREEIESRDMENQEDTANN